MKEWEIKSKTKKKYNCNVLIEILSVSSADTILHNISSPIFNSQIAFYSKTRWNNAVSDCDFADYRYSVFALKRAIIVI